MDTLFIISSIAVSLILALSSYAAESSIRGYSDNTEETRIKDTDLEQEKKDVLESKSHVRSK